MGESESARRATLFAMESVKTGCSVPTALNVASAVDDRINDCNAIKTHPMAPNTDVRIFDCCSDDLIAGGKGSNTLRGGAGNDFICASGYIFAGQRVKPGEAWSKTDIVQTADVSVATPQPVQLLLINTVIKDNEGTNQIRLNTSRASVELAPGDTLQASVHYESDAEYGVAVGGKNDESLRAVLVPARSPGPQLHRGCLRHRSSAPSHPPRPEPAAGGVLRWRATGGGAAEPTARSLRDAGHVAGCS